MKEVIIHTDGGCQGNPGPGAWAAVLRHGRHVREVSGGRLHGMSHERAEQLLAEGRAFVAPVEDELRAGLAPHRVELDSSVVVSDDAPKEILLCAGTHRSRLIALGASRRTLPERLVFGSPIEQLLRHAPSDVAVYRSVD